MQIETVTGQPVIPTERLTLRPLQRSDAGLLSHYTGDIRVARETRSVPHPLPPGAAEAFVDRALSPKRREDVWAMDGTRAGLGELVGVIGLTRMEDAPRRSEVAYWVAPAMWNTGLAQEAIAALIAANPHKAATLFASVFQDNARSARVLTNAGFEYLGDAEAFCVARGATVPTWTYLRPMGA